jgi:hypothetical protein
VNNELILNILYQTLGSGKKTARGNYAFKCPNNCHPTKHKLEINIETHQYQCWVCGGQKDGYKGSNLIKLLKQANIPSSKIDELKPLVKNNSYKPSEIQNNNVELPKEFIPLCNTLDNTIYKLALKYLKTRGITQDDILKYNIGYCENGLYHNMIIIPSYDSNGKLNYFTARSFEKNPYIKYRNPDISRDIIPFELFINWNIPIIICEGPFDAITIKRNAIPLLGKNIQPSLMKKIVTSAVKKIYIALDTDAISKAIKFAEEFMNEGKEVYLVELDKKDPSEIGFLDFTKLIQSTLPLNQYKLMEKKLSI